MLTLEFAVKLSPDQEAQIEKWLTALKSQWNLGLSALEELDRFYHWSKWPSGEPADGEKLYPVGELLCNPIKEGKFGQNFIEGLPNEPARTCPWWPPAEVGTTAKTENSPPITERVLYPAPRIRAAGITARGGLSVMARTDMVESLRNKEQAQALLDVPSKFRMGCLALLSVSWIEHTKARATRGKPKYKRRIDTIDCLYSGNLKKELRVGANCLYGVPKLGSIVVPGLSRRWKDAGGDVPPIAAFKIVRRLGKWYVQLTGDFKKVYRAPETKKSVGIDLGFIYAHTESNGTRSAALNPAEERQDKLKRDIQSKMELLLDNRLVLWLHHPDTTIEKCREFIRVSGETWEKMKQCKTAGDVCKIIGQKRDKRYQILRHRLPKSGKEIELRRQIAKLEFKGGKTRKVRNEKLATRLVRKNGFLSVEDGIQRERLRHRPAPIPTENGFAPNGAALQSEVNDQLKKLTPGHKISQLERMAARYGREFHRIASPYTTAECPVCGRLNSPSLKFDEVGDRNYSCQCGWVCDQDIHAAVNIELTAFGLNDDAKLTHIAALARTRSEQYAQAHPERSRPSWASGCVNLDPENDLRVWKNEESIELEGGKKKKKGIKPGSKKNREKALQHAG